jgi:ribosomal protein S18 acetylase RimI-like enzyme
VSKLSLKLREKRVSEEAYKIVDVTETNLNDYGLLCLKSKKNSEGYKNKLEWIKERFKEGLRLKILLVNEGLKRGLTSRGFIEYVPGEYGWRGTDAEGYMVIHCIWVVGRNKKKGYGTRLLEECFKDAKGMKGVAVVTSDNGWLPRNKLFIKNGFEKADVAPPDFELFAKRFSKNAALPKFLPISKERIKSYGEGLTVLESYQCPYSSALVNIYRKIAKEANIPIRVEHISSSKDVQEKRVHPYGSFCVLLNGKVISYRPGNSTEVRQTLKE